MAPASRPAEEDLYAMEQHLDETLQQYIHHFSMVRNTVPGITPHSIMVAFCLGVRDTKMGVRDTKMRDKLGTKNVQSTTNLFTFADKMRQGGRSPRMAPGAQRAPTVPDPRVRQTCRMFRPIARLYSRGKTE